MMKDFKIIVPSFNSVDWITKTLSSIESQTFKGFQVFVIDDASTLPQQREIILDFCRRNGWKWKFHTHNAGALAGMVEAIQELRCDDNDVIVVVDGDDWLAHDHVLEVLHQIYTDEDVYLTWGQCEIYPHTDTPMKYAQPIPSRVVSQKLFRDIPFVFWHLGTFKYFLWRHIKDEDLRDENGEYLRLMKDKATLFPMLEMAGDKIRFVSETLYIYNIDNPLNDYANTSPDEHERVDQLIRKKAKYERLV